MKLQQLRYLAAVAQNGLNITAAAEKLHTSQPAVSKLVSHTETTLGLRLFERAKGRLVPTAERVEEPELLLYEPEKNGQLRLVGLEYVVLKSAWDATHSSPPSLFGQQFNFTDAPNRYGLPPFYSLHAWIWKNNPAGMFAMWNPDVSCANA